MAESVVSFAAEHIKSLIEADLFDVLKEAKAVQEELASIEQFLLQVCEKKELANKKEFLLWLPKLRRLAYDAEDVVDTYISDAKSYSNISRGLLKMYKASQTSKELSRLRKQMEKVMEEMQKQYSNGFDGDSEKEKQGQTTTESDKEKQGQTTESEKEIGGLEEEEIEKKEIEGYNYANVSTDEDEDEEIEEEYTTETKVAGSRGSQQSNKGHRQADDEFVVGIEKDVERLVKMLTAPKGKAPLDALAIVGMGGAGKTTLARNIYNHPRVKKHFKYQVWVPLPQRWTTSEVVSTISNEIHMNKLRFECQHHHGESEHDYLVRSCLRMRKCLVVLDDVWDWESLRDLIPKLIKRENENHQQTVWDYCTNDYDITKIVITSRYQHPREPPNTPSLKIDKIEWYFHEVQLLSKDNGWDLFKKVSSSDNGKELAQEYSGLATEMLRKCGGLPLAIVALGKLLKTKDSLQDWERVFSLLVSKEGPNDLYLPVNDILALSYDDLHYNLKPCFLYFGLFPEDFLIKAGTLIRMWIAEGFVKKQDKDNKIKTREISEGEAARQLLQKLIDHTMVQVVSRNYTGKVKTLRVHDIMRDLCIKKAQEIDFLTVCSESDQITNINSRRAAMNLSKCSTPPLENSHLRSLFLHDYEGVGKHGNKGKQKEIILNLALVCEKFKLLRVLDINGSKTSDGVMPKEIGNLIHLRYLRIRSTNIRELPRTIGKLRNLLTLDYWDVSVDNCGIRLPNVLSKLRKLRHLYLPNEMTNTKESLKLHTIKDLQTLWGVRGGNWMIKEMAKLSTKISKLYIQGISSPEQMKSVLDCSLIKAEDSKLYSLALEWYGFTFEGLKALNLETDKSKLIKVRLMGKAPDSPKSLLFPSTLNKLELYYTQLQLSESMEALGKLPNLKFLRLAKDSFIGKEWKVMENSFPELENLKLFDLPKLEKWEVSKESMKKLNKLTISTCTSLKGMPEEMKPFDKFERLKTKNMPTNFIDNLQSNDTKAHSIARKLYSTILNVFSIATRNLHVLKSVMYAICIILFTYVVWLTWFKAR